MARVREVRKLVCSECENEIYKCSDCGECFQNNNEKIACISDGTKHRCSQCME